jgi:hypothetical protein
VRRIEAIFAILVGVSEAIARVARRGGNVAFRATLIMYEANIVRVREGVHRRAEGICASGFGRPCPLRWR